MSERGPQDAQRQRGQVLSLEELNRIVLEFLSKKGYARTEAMLRLESSRMATPASSSENVQTGTIPLPPPVTGPDAYSRAYLALKEWVESSLDLYQPELSRILYPVFVHMYLDLLSGGHAELAKAFFEMFADSHRILHGSEISSLAGITLSLHVGENPLAQAYLTQKYRIIMSRTSFDLLLYFLHDIEAVGGSIIIRLINKHMEMSITDSQPLATPLGVDRGGVDGDEEAALLPGEGLVGSQTSSGNVTTFNSQNVKLGKMPLDSDMKTEVGAMLEREDKQDAQDQKSLEPLEPLFAEVSKPDSDSPAPEVLPLPKYRSIDVDQEVTKMKDLRKRIKLDNPQAALPSVCMYTFHNTHNEMNTLSFSNDGTLAAGGFADSYVQLWSLKGEKLGGILKGNRSSSTSRRLIGHSGAVFGTSISPDNRTLLSCSEDKTVRLWSLDTYSALVSYKGHTEPVWDVTYGPFGHYFATASHDQTARLWSNDHIYPLRIFAGHMSDVDNVTFHPNGTYLFTGSSDKTVRMWDINHGASVRVFIGHIGSVTATAVSPDGRWLATAGEDSIINIWDIGSGRRLKTMRGHGRVSIYSLSFSQEGTVLVSGGADNSVRVWDVKKNTPEAGTEPEPFENSTKVGQSAQRKRKEVVATNDHMSVFFTKRTPVYKVQFTQRNLVLAGGAFLG